MARVIKVAAAQMGPNDEGMSRDEIVDRMTGLLELAIADGVDLIAYPEMALTTYFPKKIRPDFEQFFEHEVPPKALEPLLRRAAAARRNSGSRALGGTSVSKNWSKSERIRLGKYVVSAISG